MNIKSVVQSMLGSNWQKKLTGGNADIEYRPIIVVQARSDYGLFFMEIQYRNPGRGFDRPDLGFVLGDIPFDDGRLRSFFRAIGHTPDAYEQVSGLRSASFLGSMRLRQPRMTLFGDDSRCLERVEANNPFHGREKELAKEWGRNEYDWIPERLARLERVIFHVGGGAKPSDRAFTLNRIDIFPLGLQRDTFFTTAHCWARS